MECTNFIPVFFVYAVFCTSIQNMISLLEIFFFLVLSDMVDTIAYVVDTS